MKTKAKPVKKQAITTDTWVMLGVCLLTFLCFSHIWSNQFLYWDDNAFVSGNPAIRSFSWPNIKSLFTKVYGDYWKPLTMLSYSINYYFSKLSPGGYFFTNLIIHTANTGLVFVFIKKLLSLFWKNSKPTDALLIAGAVSLWFGIHPMHVESVGWLYERKDVLYTLFYLAGLITYLTYIKTNKTKALVYTFMWFAASCMSKPMAVVFPLSLFTIDFLMNRNFKWKPVVEKIPFLILSLIIGFYCIRSQSQANAFSHSFSLINRILIASYSFMAYIGKLFVPIHLSALYPFPFKQGESVPVIFYFCPIFILLIAVLPLYFTWKKNKTAFRVLVFGYGFYFANIALVLQFFPDGDAIISDRYSYVCYIGLFFMLAWFLNEWMKKSTSTGSIIQASVVLFTLVIGYLGVQRTYVWENTETMLTDVIAQYPGKVPQAYKYLGIYYAKAGRTQDAFNCYDMLINKMHDRDADAYCNMGSVYMSMNKPDEAAKYLEAALKIDSNQFMSYRNLGIIYANKGDYNTAFNYYNHAMRIYPNDEGLYNNLSAAYVATKQYNKAIECYNFLIRLSPDNALYYFNRGVAEYSMNDINKAIADFEQTMNMPVLQENLSYKLPANAAYNLSVIYKEKGDMQKSAAYTEQAKQLGFSSQ